MTEIKKQRNDWDGQKMAETLNLLICRIFLLDIESFLPHGISHRSLGMLSVMSIAYKNLGEKHYKK
jgi:hypothetical protein